jgi:hypothetical protein
MEDRVILLARCSLAPLLTSSNARSSSHFKMSSSCRYKLSSSIKPCSKIQSSNNTKKVCTYDRTKRVMEGELTSRPAAPQSCLTETIATVVTTATTLVATKATTVAATITTATTEEAMEAVVAVRETTSPSMVTKDTAVRTAAMVRATPDMVARPAVTTIPATTSVETS